MALRCPLLGERWRSELGGDVQEPDRVSVKHFHERSGHTKPHPHMPYHRRPALSANYALPHTKSSHNAALKAEHSKQLLSAALLMTRALIL